MAPDGGREGEGRGLTEPGASLQEPCAGAPHPWAAWAPTLACPALEAACIPSPAPAREGGSVFLGRGEAGGLPRVSLPAPHAGKVGKPDEPAAGAPSSLSQPGTPEPITALLVGFFLNPAYYKTRIKL